MTCKMCQRGFRKGRYHTCTPEQRFDRDVVRGDGCWGWNGTPDRQGYGFVTVRGRHVRAHRFSWERANGPIPDGLCVLHKCDTPSCTNPAHLFLGTRTENAKDRDGKGRYRNGQMAQPACSNCGGPFDRVLKNGWRQCTPCQRARMREWERKNRRRAAA